MALDWLANQAISYIRFTIEALSGLRYAAHQINANPSGVTIGLAPKATVTDAQGMVASAGEVTYPITPTDLDAGSFVLTDRITPYHNKLDGTISAALNGGELKAVYGGVEMLSRFKTPDVPLPSALSTTSGGAASDTVAILINDSSSTFFFTYDGLNYQSGTIPGYSTSGQSFAVFHDGYFYIFKSGSTTYYRAPEDLSGWSAQSLPSVPDTFLSAAASSGTNLVVTGEQNSGVVLRSSTGLTGSWSSSNFQLSTASRKICSDGAGTLVAAGFLSNSIETSNDDAVTWQNTLSSGLSNPIGCCRFKGNFYVFSSASNSYVYSSDGSAGSWVSGTYPTGVSVYAVEADNNIMVATGSASSDVFLVSSDGLNFKFGLFSSTYTNARWLTAFNRYILTLQRNSLSTVAAIKSTENVKADLKPVFYSDSVNTDVTIDKSTITDETFYKFTSPVADHRYHFLDSDATDSGSVGGINGTPVGGVTFDGKRAVFNGVDGRVLTGAIFSNTNLVRTVTVVCIPDAVTGSTQTLYSSSSLNEIGVSIRPSGNVGFAVRDSALAYQIVDSGYVAAVGKPLCIKWIYSISAQKVVFYVNGLRVAESATVSALNSNTVWGDSAYGAFVNGGTPAALFDGSIGLISFSDSQDTDLSAVKLYEDTVKALGLPQQYVSHNGKSRVVTVKTTGGDFTTTQAAVNALLEGNESIVVFDGISPTATGLPINAQIIDLSVSNEPIYHTWEAFD